MLDFSRHGTFQDGTGYDWDYYGDDQDAQAFYIVPRPQFASNGSSPLLSIVQYATDDPQTNGGGYCQIGLELAVPEDITRAILDRIPGEFSNAPKPRSVALAYNPGAAAFLDISDAGQTLTFRADASAFGAATATFVMHMMPAQLKSVVAAFSTTSGSLPVTYRVGVPATLRGVKATLSFDSGIAYSYQVTQATHDSWGHETSPESITKTLHESGASKVDVEWGIKDPSPRMVKAVTDWANNTLASLVQAEVKQVIALEAQGGRTSFSISSVSSFSSVYTANQVVDWLLQPSAVLPAFGHKLNGLISMVNARQQTMTVAVQLPFKGDPATTPDAAGGSFMPVPIQQIDITVRYPTLPEAKGTHSFTASGAFTFAAAYDDEAGPEWSLDYQVSFADGHTKTFAVTDIAVADGTYTLQLPEVGQLGVKFDATEAFNLIGLSAVDVHLTYLATGPAAQDFAQTVTMTKAAPTGVIKSVVSYPINQPYNYSVTYHFSNGTESYTAPTVRGKDGFFQSIGALQDIFQTNIILAFSNTDTSQFIDANVNVWCKENDHPLLTGPTKTAPQAYDLEPVAAGAMSLSRNMFRGRSNGTSPLVYSATINGLNGSVVIEEQMIEAKTPSIMITPTSRYLTVEISPSAIDWANAGFDEMDVQVTFTPPAGITSSQAGVPRLFTWHKDDKSLQYVTWQYTIAEGAAAPALPYTWSVTYVKAGHIPETTMPVSSTQMVLVIPPMDTAHRWSRLRSRSY